MEDASATTTHSYFEEIIFYTNLGELFFGELHVINAISFYTCRYPNRLRLIEN